jgi:nucleoid-associated protein YgaU
MRAPYIDSAGVSMRKIISLICFLLPILAFVAETVAFAAEPEKPTDMLMDVRSDAPDRHVVVKGDTLWDISGKFFKNPWKWPHIWGLNKDSIKDPHWIYPGDIIFLDRSSGTLRFGQPGSEGISGVAASGVSETGEETGNNVKLSPKVSESPSSHEAIPSIPASVMEPFLTQPLVIEKNALEDAPAIIGAREGRVILGNDDTGFVKGLPSDKNLQWQIYRPGKTFIDPDTGEELGIEAIYLGNAEVTRFADISTVVITHAVQEIYAGDRMVLPSAEAVNAYLPRAPESNISARVISIYGGVSQGGQNSVITLNKGARDGLESGHVLALYRKGEVVKSEGEKYALPDERYGLVFVFRVFDKVSYALVMQTRLPVQLLDRANTP